MAWDALEEKLGDILVGLAFREGMLEIFNCIFLTKLALSISWLGHSKESVLGWEELAQQSPDKSCNFWAKSWKPRKLPRKFPIILRASKLCTTRNVVPGPVLDIFWHGHIVFYQEGVPLAAGHCSHIKGRETPKTKSSQNHSLTLENII